MLRKYLEQRKADLTAKIQRLTQQKETLERSQSLEEVIAFNEQELLADFKKTKEELEEVEKHLQNVPTETEEKETTEETETIEEQELEERKDNRMKDLQTRNKMFYQTLAKRHKPFVEDFKDLVKRNVTGAKLMVPMDVLDVVYDVLKEDEVLSLCNLIQSDKQGRVTILTDFPEAFWVEKSGVNQNQDYVIHKIDFSDYTLEQFLAIDQNDEDDLGKVLEEIIGLMAKSIARKLLKDLVTGDGDRCVVGISHALNATDAPAYHSATTVPFTSLKTTNLKDVKILGKGGITEYMDLVQFLKTAKPHGQKDHTVLMNQATYDALVAVIAQVPEWRVSLLNNNNLPLLNRVVISETIEDNKVVAGYFNLYTFVLRRNDRLETSRDYKFAENKTCIKITKRIDGRPLFYDAFVIASLKPKA